jgi:alpha/beta superfamily hydrolase
VTKADLHDRLTTTDTHAACLAIPELTRVRVTTHGTNDEVVSADEAYQTFAQSIPTHKVVLVKDADDVYRGHQSELRKHVL